MTDGRHQYCLLKDVMEEKELWRMYNNLFDGHGSSGEPCIFNESHAWELRRATSPSWMGCIRVTVSHEHFMRATPCGQPRNFCGRDAFKLLLAQHPSSERGLRATVSTATFMGGMHASKTVTSTTFMRGMYANYYQLCTLNERDACELLSAQRPT